MRTYRTAVESVSFVHGSTQDRPMVTCLRSPWKCPLFSHSDPRGIASYGQWSSYQVEFTGDSLDRGLLSISDQIWFINKFTRLAVKCPRLYRACREARALSILLCQHSSCASIVPNITWNQNDRAQTYQSAERQAQMRFCVQPSLFSRLWNHDIESGVASNLEKLVHVWSTLVRYPRWFYY